MESEPRRHLEEIFRAGLRAVEPAAAVRRHVRREDDRLLVADHSYDLAGFRRVFLVGAGKAAAPMAQALEAILGERLTEGLIIVKYGHAARLKRTRVIEAGHPVPDRSGLDGTGEILHLLEQCTGEDLVICVLSGGASALLPAPAAPLCLGDKQAATRLLLESGATIVEINSIRKHLSRIKGGGLARAAHPAAVISLILSDVIGDRLDTIASGPTVADDSSYADCLAIIDRYALSSRLPSPVLQFLRDGAAGLNPETPKAGEPIFARVRNLVVGNNRAALCAARDHAEALGFHTLILSSCIEGEAREVGRVLAAVAKEVSQSGNPLAPPACLLAGGETTVTLRGNGKGGRNQELALAAAIALDGWGRVTLLSAGTDGTDGPTDAAGAFADGGSCGRARSAGLEPAGFLANNDSYLFFESLGDLLTTGPTRTNVMDMVCMFVE